MRRRIAIAAALLVIAGAGAAARPRQAGHPGTARRAPRGARHQGACPRRRAEGAVRQARRGVPARGQQLRTAREETRAKLGTQLKAGTIDAEALKSATHANLATLQKSADQFIDRLAAFHATLTPAQKTKVAEKFEKLDDWRGDEGCGGDGERHGENHDRK